MAPCQSLPLLLARPPAPPDGSSAFIREASGAFCGLGGSLGSWRQDTYRCLSLRPRVRLSGSNSQARRLLQSDIGATTHDRTEMVASTMPKAGTSLQNQWRFAACRAQLRYSLPFEPRWKIPRSDGQRVHSN